MAMFKKLLPKTLIEWLIVIAIVAILVALTLPPVQWAASGSMAVPIDVYVFDKTTMEPIEGATVAIVWVPPSEPDVRGDLANGSTKLSDKNSKTNSEGHVSIRHEFSTGASHTRPEAYAHTNWYRLVVSALGYDTVTVSIRDKSVPAKELREQGQLSAEVGMVRRITDSDGLTN